MKKAIQTRQAPAAIGPYSQAIDSGEIVFCSGQIALDPQSGALVAGGIEAETRRVLENIRGVLSEAELNLTDVVKTTIYMVDLREFDIVNRVYGEHFTAPYPARSSVQVTALPRGARIEIETIAIKRK
jgi:2-iminobutanoate/2-iminopropanoate deaminase